MEVYVEEGNKDRDLKVDIPSFLELHYPKVTKIFFVLYYSVYFPAFRISHLAQIISVTRFHCLFVNSVLFCFENLVVMLEITRHLEMFPNICENVKIASLQQLIRLLLSCSLALIKVPSKSDIGLASRYSTGSFRVLHRKYVRHSNSCAL